MAFPNSIGAAQYSALCFSEFVGAAPTTEGGLIALFADEANFTEISDIRDMPQFGTPANIVKVPVYGQAQTQSIGAQSDAPDLELMVNYVAADWAVGTTLGDAVSDGEAKVFQFSLLPAAPASFEATATGLATVDNANIYFVGKIESLLINPSRDDASTATVALSIQSDFYGPYTVDVV